jgi:hypothetical protein
MRYNLKMKIIKEFGTQKKFADKVKIRPQRLSAIIQGDRPSTKERERIADILGDYVYLFYNKEN